MNTTTLKDNIVVLFAGDSGDGMQLIGELLGYTSALSGNDISTFPNYPAEIRAPQGTLHGVSGFQIRLADHYIFTPGDEADILVAMNPAALKTNVRKLKPGGVIILNINSFDKKNLALAGYEIDPVEELSKQFKVFPIEITKIIRDQGKDSGLGTKQIDRSKNMFALGLVLWLLNKTTEQTATFIKRKFSDKPELLQLNLKALEAGYNYGETAELIISRTNVGKASLPPGTYRSITGNQGLALGLITSAHLAGTQLFYASYPITPASDILHELSKHKQLNVLTFQAEDEIAAISAAIGASFAGSLGVTATSGPGMDLKSEALGLAVMLELPLVVCDIQRGGPSTGLPTKTEQSDLLFAMFGRHGEAPLPVLAVSRPADCFETAIEACRLAIEFMTPVILLSDAYIANALEPWKIPDIDKLHSIEKTVLQENERHFAPYRRNEKGAREWAVPGVPGKEHRIGGLEKEDLTGNISYDPENHQHMVLTRKKKIENIAQYIPLQKVDSGPESGKMAIVGWGSTYGSIKTACEQLRNEGVEVSHIHLRYLNPFPSNLLQLLNGFEKILIPELNTGQLAFLLESHLKKPVEKLNKVKGVPFTVKEIKDKVLSIIR